MAADVEVLSRRGNVARLALGAYGGLIYIFLFGPIVLLVLFSFNANRDGAFPITRRALNWYRAAVDDYQIHDAPSTPPQVGGEGTALRPLLRPTPAVAPRPSAPR